MAGSLVIETSKLYRVVGKHHGLVGELDMVEMNGNKLIVMQSDIQRSAEVHGRMWYMIESINRCRHI